MNSRHLTVPIRRFGTGPQPDKDVVTVEEPLEIRIAHIHNGSLTEHSLSVTMRTPGDDIDLSYGFLLSEGIIEEFGQVETVNFVSTDAPDVHNTLTVTLRENTPFDPESLLRHFYTSSSCGVCGKVSIAAVQVHIPTHQPSKFHIKASELQALPSRLTNKQLEFQKTGGLHASAIFNSKGEILRIREDVGRHNALDKLIGSARSTSSLPGRRDCGLLLSGRASFELIQKAAIAGFPLVAAIGSPSSLAIDLAKAEDITLIGFLRNNGFNLFHGSRLISD